MSKLPLRFVIAQAVAMLAALAVVIPAEIEHWQSSQAPNTSWFVGINIDTTLPGLLMLVLPYFWFVRRPFWVPNSLRWMKLKAWWTAGPLVPSPISPTRERGVEPTDFRTHATSIPRLRVGLVLAILSIAVTSLFVSDSVFTHRVGDREQYRFGELPPAYHDEYSYLFQADTYLAGRLSWDSHPTAARLFDQMHVLNEGRFASRYFPATGLFVAPWCWLGWPILGHWLAGVATCVLVFGIGRELSNNGTGFVAGMLTALSPGMGLFGNLMLAHHPTLLGLFFFAWCFVRWLRTDSMRDVVMSGIGLSWAMLCRPMTAAGFGLPFGIWFVWRLWQRELECRQTKTICQTLSEKVSTLASWRRAIRACLGLALPLVVGFVLLGIHNHAITGRVTKTPYQVFTEIYTPRHGYGFNNVVRGEQQLGPRVLDHYDRWAENLTPTLALENTKNRLIASWQWTLGIVPLLMSSVWLVSLVIGNLRPALNSQPSTLNPTWWLIVAAIVSLFAVHVPYWFDGMFHWHYVFETGPLWCLILAAATDTICRNWLAVERPRMPVWWAFVVGSTVLVNHVEMPQLWYPSKLVAGVEQIAFSRLKYQALDELLQREIRQRPALVLIEADPADRHIDYVVNEPSLSAEILRGRFPVADWPLKRIAAEFPHRAIYLFRAKTGELKQVSAANEK